LIELLSAQTTLLWAAVVSAVVSALVSYVLRRREARHKLELEYEYEQRKALRHLIGRYHGRLLNAANSMNHRLWNFYHHEAEGWLDAKGQYTRPGYYLLSFVYRFLSVSALIRQFENEAIYIDRRIADQKDFAFLNYVTALQWVLTDVALFANLPYDSNSAKDHFFADQFRNYADACLVDGKVVTFENLEKRLQSDRSLDSVLAFFDGLCRSEDRLRWDRLVAFHLLLLAFINAFGYKTQYSPGEQRRDAAGQIKNAQVLANLAAWLPQHGLDREKEGRRLLRILMTATRGVA
jgi:hypothetical protein